MIHQDVDVCPAFEPLSPNHDGKPGDLKKVDYRNPAACPGCPLRPRRTPDRRLASRLENEAVLDRMAARLKARPEILDRRRELAGHPSGQHLAMDDPRRSENKGVKSDRESTVPPY